MGRTLITNDGYGVTKGSRVFMAYQNENGDHVPVSYTVGHNISDNQVSEAFKMKDNCESVCDSINFKNNP